MNKKLIELITLWDEFESNHSQGSLEEFFKYNLNKKLQEVTVLDCEQKNDMSLNVKLGRTLSILYKFSYFYSKQALMPLELNNIGDFLYLIGLSRMGSLTKSELIDHFISEFTSGIEVIKRLVKMGLVTEFANEEDKRSTKLKLTEKGNELLNACYPVLKQVWDIVFGQLNEQEISTIFFLLQKAELHHTELYPKLKNKDFETIKKSFNKED